PIEEYFFACGQTLGRLHQLSKNYNPVHRRCHFLEEFTTEDVNALVPDSLSLCKEKLLALFTTLAEMDQSPPVYGMIHGDFHDENYHVDVDTGQITVFDFDNACFGWYMHDLANLWMHAIHWTEDEPNQSKRKQLTNRYFERVIAGYRGETALEDATLESLPLFVQANLMLGIIAAFEDMRDSDEAPEDDEELEYIVKCFEDDIPYGGFFYELCA
ncbi:MAG: phosphotransferase, partial [Defluviitaleaceae bacterium]|nr:phosphotransferase [Defluviitaleaceae bacterium]